MDARFVQRGDAIDYRPDRDVEAGEIVLLGSLVGVAKMDIKSGELGALALEGVFDVTKPLNYVMHGCSIVHWSPSRKSACIRSVEDAVPIGHCAKTFVTSSAPTMPVRLCQGVRA